MTVSQHGHQLYAALDAQDWERVHTLVSPDVVVQVGSSPPTGLEQWRRNQERFYAGFPDTTSSTTTSSTASDS